MSTNKVLDKIKKKLESCATFDYADGFTTQKLERLKAMVSMQTSSEDTKFTSELKTITHLVDSHAPSLSSKISIDYEIKVTMDESKLCLNSENVKQFSAMDSIRRKLEEMPEEWTFVQFTPHLDASECIQFHNDKYVTNALYISVFQCGGNQPKAYCVSVGKPIDKITNQVVPLKQEIEDIINANKNSFKEFLVNRKFVNMMAKKAYWNTKEAIACRTKALVHDLETIYLKEWRCLLAGKYVDKILEKRLAKCVINTFGEEVLTKKQVRILISLLKNYHHMRANEIRSVLLQLFPALIKNKERLVQIQKNLTKIHDELQLRNAKKHSLILIVDETLDAFPWEMMTILQNDPVTRVPSLHIAYALYKEHESTIKNGFKQIHNPKNGNYILNPGLDLSYMEGRISSFIKYWLGSWKGIQGVTPTEEQFKQLLTTSDIFSYHGHGSGAQYLHPSKVRKLRVNAVVLLFGCGSIRVNRVNPRVAMEGSYQMYLIACSPCIIGMLWEVSDLDTDILTTEFLSTWISNKSLKPWNCIDKAKWKQGIDELKKQQDKENSEVVSIEDKHKPELLEALNAAKKSQAVRNYLTKAACVARGIPIKIVNSN